MAASSAHPDVKADGVLSPSISFGADWKRFRVDEQSIEDLVFPVVVIDDEGTIQHISKAARRLLEYPPDADIDPCFFAHVHGKNLYRVMQDVAHMVCYGQQQTTWLLRLRTGRGRWRWYRATAEPERQDGRKHIIIRLIEV